MGVPKEEDIRRCGHDYDPEDKVCPECGAQLWSQEDYELVEAAEGMSILQEVSHVMKPYPPNDLLKPRSFELEDGTIYTEPTWREVEMDEVLKQRGRDAISARVVSPKDALHAMLVSHPEYEGIEAHYEGGNVYVFTVESHIDHEELERRAKDVLPVDISVRIEVKP